MLFRPQSPKDLPTERQTGRGRPVDFPICRTTEIPVDRLSENRPICRYSRPTCRSVDRPVNKICPIKYFYLFLLNIITRQGAGRTEKGRNYERNEDGIKERRKEKDEKRRQSTKEERMERRKTEKSNEENNKGRKG